MEVYVLMRIYDPILKTGVCCGVFKNEDSAWVCASMLHPQEADMRVETHELTRLVSKGYFD